MLTSVRIVERAEQPYAAIKAQVGVGELGSTGPALHRELRRWLKVHDIEPAGPPFFKYNVIDMARGFEMEFGFPTARVVGADDRVASATLPSGRYATLVFRGPYDQLLGANAALVDWGKTKGIAWDVQETPAGDRFNCRLEIYRTDEAKQPDPAQWETEVTIRLSDQT
jgi:effector-binding domain-containing protein